MAVDCYRRGMLEPIPLFPKFSYKLHKGTAGERLATLRGHGDGDDEANRLVFGTHAHRAARPSSPGRRPARQCRSGRCDSPTTCGLRWMPAPRKTDELETDICSPVGPLPGAGSAIEASAGPERPTPSQGSWCDTWPRRTSRSRGSSSSPSLGPLRPSCATGCASRLIEAVAALRAPSDALDDELLAFVARTDRERRLGRLEQAVVDFDSATITTIHGFAQQFLSPGLGGRGRSRRHAARQHARAPRAGLCRRPRGGVVRRLGDRRAAPSSEGPLRHGREGARQSGDPAPSRRRRHRGDPCRGRLRRLVDRAVEEVHRRRRAAGTVSFDDLLTELRDALDKSPAAAAALAPAVPGRR